MLLVHLAPHASESVVVIVFRRHLLLIGNGHRREGGQTLADKVPLRAQAAFGWHETKDGPRAEVVREVILFGLKISKCCNTCVDWNGETAITE